MKKIIVCPKLLVDGLAIFPFILVKDESYLSDKKLINHEKIHLRQEIELLIIPFYIIYGINWVINYFRYGSWIKAYSEIIFEREAYINDADLEYLENRKPFSFIKYFFNKPI